MISSRQTLKTSSKTQKADLETKFSRDLPGKERNAYPEVLSHLSRLILYTISIAQVDGEESATMYIKAFYGKSKRFHVVLKAIIGKDVRRRVGRNDDVDGLHYSAAIRAHLSTGKLRVDKVHSSFQGCRSSMYCGQDIREKE